MAKTLTEQGVMVKQEQDSVAIDSDTDIDLDPRIIGRPHVFISAYFVDANGAQVTPTAGTVTFTIETANSPGNFESIVNGSNMDATSALQTIDASGNHTKLRVSPSSISGNNVDSMVVVITANEG